MDPMMLRFYLKAFHIALFFILFCCALFLWIKNKNVPRFLFVVGFLFLGGFRPQLFIAEDTNLTMLYFNALLIDIAGIIFAASLFVLIKQRKC